MTTPRNRPLPLALIALATIAVLFGAVFAFSAPAQAQEPRERPFDLSIVAGSSESKRHVLLTVTNHGDEDAFGVQVKLELTESEGTVFKIFASDIGIQDRDVEITPASATTAIWNIGRLPAGDSIELEFSFSLPSPGATEDIVVSATATLSSEAPVEEDIYLDNNSLTVWRADGMDGNQDGSFISHSGVQLEAAIDDLFPSTGENVTFTVFAANTSSGARIAHRGLLFDAKVDVELDGLTLVSATTTPSDPANTTTFSGAVGDSRGTWDIGDDIPLPGRRSELEIVAALDGDRPLEDRCLTARVTEARPGIETHEDYDEESTVTVCLGEDPTVVIDSGNVDLMFVYPCIGVATYPCDDTDTLELVTFAPSRPGGIQRTDLRHPLIHSSFGQTMLRPEDVIIQVKFPFGFHPEDDTWLTAQTNGVNHSWDQSRILPDDWTHNKWTTSGPSDFTLPGGFSLRLVSTPTFAFVDPANTTVFGPAAYTNAFDLDTFAIFEKLGTYKFEITIEMTHATIDADMDNEKDKFTASGTYTFHAGPIAELAVEDGPASPQITADRRAFTIVATNNGPDTALGARVTVTGLSTADYVSHTATRGSFNPGTGIWDIGELPITDRVQSVDRRDGEVLTIVTREAAGSEIAATIANAVDYTICINSFQILSSDYNYALDYDNETACEAAETGASWHTGPVLDYRDDNNSATIQARDGTGAGLPSLRGAQPRTAAIEITWDAETEVNGRPVTHYEVEWSADGASNWRQLSDDLAKTRYVDTGVVAGATRYYRMRAVNTRGQKGLWSQPTQGMVAEVETGTTVIFIGGAAVPSGPTPSDADFEWAVTHDLDELDSGHDTPTGMWSDGTTLWLANNPDGAGDAIYAYDLGTGERVEDREFELDERNRAPGGLWSDGETIWISDSGQDHLYAYDLATGERLADRDIALDERNADPRGIWSDGETMWVLDDGKDSLFAYALASAELLAEYDLDSFNASPVGIWSDGAGLWVSDPGSSPRSLFAYRLPTREQVEGAAGDASLERVSGEDFTELSPASNNSPRGLWSDGEVMYVADANDGKVYTYNMPVAINARLASLTLEGIDIGEFDPRRTGYEGVIAEGVTETVVTAGAMQRRADVVIDPPDADEEADGHQVDLATADAITVTVTSADGSRERVYRVALERAPEESRPHCLRGDLAAGFNLVVFEGGTVEELAACAESRDVVALYALHEGAYVSFFLGAPEFVNERFRQLFPDGIPVATPFVAGSE